MTTQSFSCRSRFALVALVALITRPTCCHADDAIQQPSWAAAPGQLQTFLENHCLDCHEGEAAEAGLDLTTLAARPADAKSVSRWVQVFDRVHAGEMPPADVSTVEIAELHAFLNATRSWLATEQRREQERWGRVRGRRLTNLQLERTLQDLLGIDIPLASLMPEDQRTGGFSTVADGQSMSHFQLEQHLAVVDAALEEAFRRAMGRPDEWQRQLHAKSLSRRRARSRTREPEMSAARAIVWSSRLAFYGRLPSTTARESGWYRFVVRASALKSPADRGVWCTVRSGKCVSSAPMLSWVGAFEATDDPCEVSFETWLPQGHMLEIRPGDATLKMARFRGGQVGTGEGEPQNVPGVALEWITMERIHRGPGNAAIRQILFADRDIAQLEDAEQAAVELMRAFATRAFRRPVAADDLEPYVDLVRQSLDEGTDFAQAVRGGYRALLCSPRFLHFHESPGALDDYAIASRLSYLLWNSLPDAPLLRLADQGQLREPDVLRGQLQRMLADERGRNFVRDFAAEWLDLSLIDFTEPDRRLYPAFDVIVQHSMLQETEAFLASMLQDNLSIAALIDSDFTFLNSRLARFYRVEGVRGHDLRRVPLKPEHHRGGLLTQGAILKVTANGTTTSPVIRGVWVSERLLGQPIPPPPQGVPAIEPDIRGAKTIREMLAKHRSIESCAACHVKIDPPGFALENYDPAGQWRTHYTAIQRGKRGKGIEVDAGYTMPDGREFDNVEQFRKLVLSKPTPLARNVVEKLLTYGTGAPPTFADRAHLDQIVARTQTTNFGFRSLLEGVVLSPVFLTK